MNCLSLDGHYCICNTGYEWKITIDIVKLKGMYVYVYVLKRARINVNQKQKTIHVLVEIIGELKKGRVILVIVKQLKDIHASVNMASRNVRLVIKNVDF